MQSEITRQSLSVSHFFANPLRAILSPMDGAIQRLFAFDELWQLYETAQREGQHGAVERVLAALGIGYHLDPQEIDNIPRSGPVVAVANHPFGLLDGALLAIVLPRIRPDVRILANSFLEGVPELREQCIFINPFGHKEAIRGNARALRECLGWLRGGGMLVTFPAGEVAHPEWGNETPADPPWNPAVGRIAKLAGASALPIFFQGSNSVAFHLAGTVHPALRTVSLPRELLNKRGQRIRIRIGRPVSSATLEPFSGSEVIEYLRCRTYLLDETGHSGSRGMWILPPLPKANKHAPIAAAVSPSVLAAEIARLAPERKLCESGEFAVYLARQSESPEVVRELGRLREIAFRGAGEGTGRSIDLDQFDQHYLHLVLWDHSSQHVAGAYRLGPTPDILPRLGVGGLYTSTLFRYGLELFDQIGPAIELGRSFIRPECQRQFAPLFLLWKAIARYVAGRPECARLFGSVSISNAYHPVSRHLIVKFLDARRAEHVARLVTPRTPYQPDGRMLRRTGVPSNVPESIDDLSGLIAGLERDGKGLPILLKQYLKAGGRVLGFNVDRRFSHVLDALVMVDLRVAPVSLMERHLGKTGARAFAASAVRH
ncbi:MAG TPA: GNAT family N-acyltransferase [Bryobacteraceae bacterium]|jgi:putative hemolysin|nr:GNAT family N-acyltransferase [Bryobacteraceae bacterium]